MPRVDYSGRAEAYERSRTLPPAVLDVWTRTIEGLELPDPATVLDLGAGTGGFVQALGSWFGATVVASEPSESMRARALSSGAAAGAAYVAGAAERLPLRDAAVDLAWLSTVVHQFDDLMQATRELRRVIRPGGRVLVRGFLADVPVTGLLAFFPGIDRSAASFPSTPEVVHAFTVAGFAAMDAVDVVEPWSFSLDEWLSAVDSVRDTDSALRPLSDAEVQEGIQRVRTSHTTGDPLHSPTTLRLLVLQR